MKIPQFPLALLAGALLLAACGDNTNASTPAAATPATSATSAAAAAGSGQACVSRYSATMFGERMQEHSCIRNISLSEGEFRQACEELAEMGREMAASGMPGVEVHDQSLDFAASCPANPIGTCRGVSDGTLDFLYYEHPDAASLPQGCQLLGGEWEQG